MPEAAGDVIDFNPYEEASQELEWYFGQSEAAIRISGIDYRSFGAASGVEDVATQHRRHMVLRERDPILRQSLGDGELALGGVTRTGYRAAVRRRGRVGATLAVLDGEVQHTLLIAYTPRRFDWRDDRSAKERQGKELGAYEDALRQAFRAFRSQSVCLLALALETTALREAFLSYPGQVEPPGQPGDREARVTREGHPEDWPTRGALFEFLQLRASRKTIQTAAQAAATSLLNALRAYDGAMHARNDAQADMRRARAQERIGRATGLEVAGGPPTQLARAQTAIPRWQRPISVSGVAPVDRQHAHDIGGDDE